MSNDTGGLSSAVDTAESKGTGHLDDLRTVERDDRQFFERVVRETATLLDEEYVDSAVLDWQDAFDAA